MNEPAEELIWKGPPSQLTAFWFYVGSIVAMGGLIAVAAFTTYWVALGAVIPLAMAGWKWMEIRCRVYEVTSDRIKFHRGVLTRVMHELELYRVRDTTLVSPFWFRIFGKGNVVLSTTDASTPTLELEAVPQASQLREQIRKAVEKCRARKGVRYTEFGGELDMQ
jgi:uncharacterized membrane protein YdbT with pleckstrin-like domain